MAGDASVIVAEENPAVAGALSWLLREQGYEVTTVTDERALFEMLEQRLPDLVLLDGERVERDASIIGRLRGDDRWLDVRVIVAAPWAGIEDGTAALPWGADDCVSKPFRVPELLGRVRTQLRASAQLRAARLALRDTAAELERTREAATHNRRLVDILHEVTSELSAADIYRTLVRRVAHARNISHCSVVLARSDGATGTVVAAAEDPAVSGVDIALDRYPEITTALQTGRAVLVEDARIHPLFESARHVAQQDNRSLDTRSVATIPFSVDRWRSGVLMLRTERTGRTLDGEDVAFAETVLRAAAAAMRRAQALETTRSENRRLEALATTDPLTRVLNRRALVDRLGAELDRARRFGSSLTMLLLDVDHFKQINDGAGHLAGDSVLRQLGALLDEAVRKVDIVARYGGEEFVLLLPETGMDGGTVFAERLRERIASQSFEITSRPAVYLTVSIGIATFPSPQVSSIEDLFAHADEALYRAKSAGRNQVRA